MGVNGPYLGKVTFCLLNVILYMHYSALHSRCLPRSGMPILLIYQAGVGSSLILVVYGYIYSVAKLYLLTSYPYNLIDR